MEQKKLNETDVRNLLKDGQQAIDKMLSETKGKPPKLTEKELAEMKADLDEMEAMLKTCKAAYEKTLTEFESDNKVRNKSTRPGKSHNVALEMARISERLSAKK